MTPEQEQLLIKWNSVYEQFDKLAPTLPAGEFREYLLSTAIMGAGTDFFLEHAQYWTPAANPAWLAPGAPQYCFDNAQRLALEHPELTYVEGYATFALAVPHGWCVDAKGNVIDPTCDNPLDVEYFGIAIDSDKMAQLRMASSEASLFFGFRAARLRDSVNELKSRSWHPVTPFEPVE